MKEREYKDSTIEELQNLWFQIKRLEKEGKVEVSSMIEEVDREIKIRAGSEIIYQSEDNLAK